VALVRRKENEALVREAREGTVGEDGSAAEEFAPYHLVLESLGRQVLSGAPSMLAPGGTRVTFGISVDPEATSTFVTSSLGVGPAWSTAL
jgi:hypothetical protein